MTCINNAPCIAMALQIHVLRTLMRSFWKSPAPMRCLKTKNPERSKFLVVRTNQDRSGQTWHTCIFCNLIEWILMKLKMRENDNWSPPNRQVWHVWRRRGEDWEAAGTKLPILAVIQNSKKLLGSNICQILLLETTNELNLICLFHVLQLWLWDLWRRWGDCDSWLSVRNDFLKMIFSEKNDSSRILIFKFFNPFNQ